MAANTKERGRKRHVEPRRGRALATSFVVTFTSVQGLTGCTKKTAVEPEMETSSASVYRGPADGRCYRTQSMRCPKGLSCNPPPPLEVDCPPKRYDAGSDPPPITRRPPGKEDWLRVTPQLVFLDDQRGCIYTPEWFCTPAESKVTECTAYPEALKVACSRDGDGGTRRFEPFVYKDALGTCRKVLAGTCAPAFSGRCAVTDGEVAACENVAPAFK